jgi:uncharacterized membrane protein
VAIATGVAGILTYFPGGVLVIQPVLMIAGGMAQHHFQRLGKWFLGLGAAGLSIILGQYDVLLFQHPVPPAEYVRLPLPFPSLLLATTILALWCDIELIVHYLRSRRTRQFDPSTKPVPVRRGTWIFVALHLWVGWSVVGALRRLHYPGGISMLLMSAVWVVAVVVLDIELAVKTKHAPRAEMPPSR